MQIRKRIDALEAAAVESKDEAGREASSKWFGILWDALQDIEPGGIDPDTGLRCHQAMRREDRVIAMGDRVKRDAVTDYDRALLASMLEAEAAPPGITLHEYVVAMGKICAMM